MTSKALSRTCPVCDCASGALLHTQCFALSEGHPLPPALDFVACDGCGFCFADTSLPQSAYDAYYAGMSKYADSATSTGAGLSVLDAGRLEQMAGQVAAFEPNPTARLLDIGCANGGLLAALQARGYTSACGIDPAPACVQHARQVTTGTVHAGTLSALPDNIGTFDGIILSHVLEHVCDLRPAMDRVRHLLNPGGWVYLEVPDAARYEPFLVAPFQDFNTEHINHFSALSLANLCRLCGFLPVAGGAKEIFSVKDLPYPAVFQFGRKADAALAIEKDQCLSAALEGYVRASHALMARIDHQIGRILTEHRELIVWGTGQLTMKLLAATCLRDANIVAFVDGNPVNQGTVLRGSKVVGGGDLTSSATPILVCSLINSATILTSIRNLRLTNPVLTLSPLPA